MWIAPMGQTGTQLPQATHLSGSIFISSREPPALQAYFLPFSITPQAMRSPELPDGSVALSSAVAWTTMALPSWSNSEFAPAAKVTASVTRSEERRVGKEGGARGAPVHPIQRG